MKILGLILECNPFHNGHEYFIKKSISTINPDYTIAIISGSFTMRGDVSILNKFDKTKILLSKGIDIVVELPVNEVPNSANYYAKNVCKILFEMGVTDIAFGTEGLSKDALKYYNAFFESEAYKTAFNKYYSTYTSYKKAHYNACNELTPNDAVALSLPNNTLALQYFSYINEYNITNTKNAIEIHPIERVGETDDKQNIISSSSYQSATALRNYFLKGKSIKDYIPYDENILCHVDYEKLWSIYVFSCYKDYLKNQYAYSVKSKEGIDNYVIKRLKPSNDYKSALDNLKNTRYSISMFRRNIIKRLLSTNLDNFHLIDYGYIRLLGFSKKAENLLNELNKNLTFITTLKKKYSIDIINEYISCEKLATRLYEIITMKDLYKQEFLIPIKDGKQYE